MNNIHLFMFHVIVYNLKTRGLKYSSQHHHHHIIIRFLIKVQVQGHHPYQWVPFQVNWLAARKAYLTPDVQVLLS